MFGFAARLYFHPYSFAPCTSLFSIMSLSAKALFERVQQQHPGQFKNEQLRTFQHRVRAWRMTYIVRQSELSQLEAIPLMTS
jgi:hypothetical protein